MQAPVGRGLAQAVQVPDRDQGQPLVAEIAELLVLALANAPGRRPRQALVQTVGLGQQGHIPRRVTARIGLARAPAPVANRARLAAWCNQPGQLRWREPGRLAQIGSDRPLARLAQMRIAKLLVGGFNEAVGFETGSRLQIERVVAGR